MQDLAQGVRQQIIKETAPKVAPAGAFTMRSLRHAALWGATAAVALLIAALSSRGDFDVGRLADAFRGGSARRQRRGRSTLRPRRSGWRRPSTVSPSITTSSKRGWLPSSKT